MAISIEMSSNDPLVTNVKSTYRIYSQTQSQQDRKTHFKAISQIYQSFDLPKALALNSPSYIYQAERLQNGDSRLAPIAKAYTDKLTELESELQKQFPGNVKEKLADLGRAHNGFMKEFIPEFERQNPEWRDCTMKLVPIS